MTSTKTEKLHVVFVVDTTGSMQSYLTALNRALCQVCSLVHVLLPESADISVICYEDYGDGKRLLRQMIQKPFKELYDFCSRLVPGGGADLAEASKTALVCLSKLIKYWKGDTTIVFHYTDAPPHHKLTNPSGRNRPKEEKALKEEELGSDWCKISRRFRKVSDRVKIFTIVPEDSPAGGCGAAFYALLGELLVLPHTTATIITKTTMSLLLQLMGQENDTKFRRVTFQRYQEVMDRLDNGECTEDDFPELNTKCCMEPGFTPTPRNTQDLEWTDGWVYPAMPMTMEDESQIKLKFKQNQRFRDTVFESMTKLVQPENAMALTSYPILGRMWRLVCTCREDTRLASMQARMGECVGSKMLSEAERAELKDWLDASYDNSEEMNEMIESHNKQSRQYYVMDTFSTTVPDVNGLRSLARSPCPKALAAVQNILSHVMLVNAEDGADPPVDGEGNCRYLPMGLDDYQLFTMLPHLIQPGTQYSLKPAAVLAILCCRSSNSLLEERAKRFLLTIRGKWLPPVDRIDRAEIISYEFSSLVAGCPVDGALTDAENAFFRRLHDIWRYRRSRFETFDVRTHISPTRPMLLPDSKRQCKRCGFWTSETLMDGNDKCGICLWESESKDNKWTRPKPGQDYFVETCESYIVECTCCQVLYAVLGPADLNVPPKCHFCRFGRKGKKGEKGAPYRRCNCCKAKWCDPSLSIGSDESGDYVCPICSIVPSTNRSDCSEVSMSSHHASLQKLVDENPTWVKRLGFRPKGGSIIFSSARLYQAVVDNRVPLFEEPVHKDVGAPLLFEGKPILNEDRLLENIRDRVATSTFTDTCQLCYDEMAVEKLRPSCGHCLNRCCVDCLGSWYGQNAPGQLFVPSHDMCPFCRLRPTYQVLVQHNHAACGIVGLSRRKGLPLSLRADWYYGWCKDCWKVAYAMARNCADGIPQLRDFVCEDCEEKAQMLRLAEADNEARTRLLLEQAKPCPGCQMKTVHLGGCSHMTCANPECRKHWCWQCGDFAALTGAEVYDHMRQKHGGYGWIADDDGMIDADDA